MGIVVYRHVLRGWNSHTHQVLGFGSGFEGGVIKRTGYVTGKVKSKK